MCYYSGYFSCYIGKAVCQQLGYPGALSLRTNAGLYYGYYYYNDNYRYYCYSTAKSVSDCGSPSYYYACGNYNDAQGVVCAPQDSGTGSECTAGSVRLTNGTTVNQGRVEYCFNGFWSPMCSLTTTTASVVCQTLGYNFTCKIE
jgi:deleted-in-malignant-brain-tumors protein 1